MGGYVEARVVWLNCMYDEGGYPGGVLIDGGLVGGDADRVYNKHREQTG